MKKLTYSYYDRVVLQRERCVVELGYWSQITKAKCNRKKENVAIKISHFNIIFVKKRVIRIRL